MMSYGQEENWEVYIAKYEKGNGAVTLNMSLKDLAPKADFNYLIAIDLKFNNCGVDGFPTTPEYQSILAISEDMRKEFMQTIKAELVGTFTYNCHRQEYYYVKDTVSLRKHVFNFLDSKAKDFESQLILSFDKRWEHYLSFLYPNEAVLDQMINQKVIDQLVESGSDLSKPLKVSHWLFFTNSLDRSNFLKAIESEEFGVEPLSKSSVNSSFSLVIYRNEFVDPITIGKLTVQLKKLAATYNGTYDGWVTP